MSDRLFRLLILLGMNAVADTMAFSFFVLYAYKSGLDYTQIILSYLIMYGLGAALIALSPRYGQKRNMSLGLVFKGTAALMLAMPINDYMFILFGALNGMSLRFFWVPYNAYFMEAVRRDKRAESSGGLFFLLAASGAVMPLVGGLIISVSGYKILFIISFFCFLAGALYATLKVKQPAFVVNLGWENSRRLAFLALEGVWQGAFWISVPFATIFFLKKEMEFGMFMAFLGAAGGLASILIGRYSDLKRDRKKPLAVAAILASLGSIAAAFSTGNLLIWSIIVGMTYFFIFIMYSFTFTYAREACVDSYTAMATRELFLNSGRVMGAVILLVFLKVTGLLFFGFIAGALSLLVMGLYVLRAKDNSCK